MSQPFAILMMSAGVFLIIAANVMYYWMIHRLNASGQLDEEIGWLFQHPAKAIKVVSNYKRIYRSRLPEIGWLAFWLGLVLAAIGLVWLQTA